MALARLTVPAYDLSHMAQSMTRNSCAVTASPVNLLSRACF